MTTTEAMQQHAAGAKVTVERRSDSGEVVDLVDLEPAIFGMAPNVPLMHQVVTAQLAARRAGTHSTKTRSEVAGGGAKPYRQKGTGRARQGTIRAPQFAGGGVALGPKPRSYAQRTPRKMVRLALHSALSDRAAEGRVCVVDQWTFAAPRTRDAVQALDDLGLSGRVLVVLGDDDAVVERSFANLQRVHLVEGAQLTAYEVLANDWVVFSSKSLPGGVRLSEASEPTVPSAESEARRHDVAVRESRESAEALEPEPAPIGSTADAGASADAGDSADDGEGGADAADELDGEDGPAELDAGEAGPAFADEEGAP